MSISLIVSVAYMAGKILQNLKLVPTLISSYFLIQILKMGGIYIQLLLFTR